ncbi:MAG: MBL fold metallo-hydrolase [Dyella sp.]|uniref:MBL fold metallo-hydrolase n=1 Tax=Dyella sp. TaxID=1869338 RepID=UPI003F7D1B10
MPFGEKTYYLREDVYVEPLILKWYAWPYLVPPVSAAMNLAGRSLRLMKSFVANPQLHRAASQNPGLAGGDFVDCSEDQVEAIRALIDTMETEHGDLMQLRQAVIELNQLLQPMQGMSLEPLYASLPQALRGYVELVYDMNHSPTFRLIEGLLYEGTLYKPQVQSVSLGRLKEGKPRPFVLSSPRLPDANHLHLELEFVHPGLDALFASRTSPVTREELRRILDGVPMQGAPGFAELMSSEPPALVHRPTSDKLCISYLGHAGLMLETPRTTILVDPVIATRDGQRAEQVISFSQLPPSIDYICLTHTHMDHVCIETLLQLRHKTRFVLVPKNNGGSLADPSLKLLLGKIGFKTVEMEDMETLDCPDGRIRALPFLGEHADLNIRSKTAWLFEFAGEKIFSGADSSSIDECLYQRIHRLIGDIDLLFIGMECVGAPMSWLYGSLFSRPIPRMINESRRFNGSDYASAQKIVDIFRPREVYVYALGMEPWFRYFMGMDYDENARQIQESGRLLASCAQRGIRAERLFAKRVWTFN